MEVVIHRNAVAPSGVTVVGRYYGELKDYRGECKVVYTDEGFSDMEFYYWKYRMLQRNVELIRSAAEIPELEEFTRYLVGRSSYPRHAGRLPFGFMNANGVVVKQPEKVELAREIIGLRDKGMKYRQIKSELGISLSLSTICRICGNRELYE